ncbi:hypothetical protein RPMA_12505 [Tardiphaga alba]|uniref:Uncharacterized protein n=1 Tax=Tardiphaga alba TaxID=340268 RepID=A0ABX8A983_9BRAD|nr:hypothetical protein [Tardiphaga alba]QUS39566.1 hypothetical protein RPMA_12505 [Tardiphaga alba]
MRMARWAFALAFALVCAPAFGQTGEGSSPLSVPKGGSGRNSLDANKLVFGNGTAPVQLYGCTGFLVGTGSGAAPTCRVIAAADLPANLTSIANATTAANRLGYWTASATYGLTDFTAFARSLLDDADAATARATLGVSIGSNVQAWDADLDALAALSGTNTIYYRSGANTWSAVSIGSLLSFATGTLNVGDAELVALAGLTSAADKVPYFTGSGTAALADFSSLARTLVANTAASGMRSTLGLVIGTDVQAYDAELAALAGLTSAANKCFYFTGAGIAATVDCTSFGRSVANAADAAALRTLAGTVIGTNVQAWDADLDALAANSTDGFWARTGAGTGAARVMTAPAAGFTITNPAGVAGNPTFVLANDLAALEALSSTGIARRTGTDAWSVGTLVSNTELATMPNATFKCRTTAGTGSPDDCTSAQSTALLNTMGGDAGSGGTKGLVPAPGAGDAAANKVLGAGGTWVTQSGGGGGGLSDADRQNILLERGYQSKTFGGYRRFINAFADGYKASDGVNSGASSNYNVVTASGYVAPSGSGGSQLLIPGATGTASGVGMSDSGGTSGIVSQAFDGNLHNASGSSVTTNSNGVHPGSYAAGIRKDWGSGNAKFITQFVLSTSSNLALMNVGGASTVKLQGSNNGTTWVDLFTSGSTGAAANTDYTFNTGIDTSTAYRYHQVMINGNGSNSAIVAELQFYETPPIVVNNMTLVTTYQSSDTTVTNGRLLIEYDPLVSVTLNTDITAEVTCNGGANWTPASLSAVSNFSGGAAQRKVAESVDQLCSVSGSSFGARLKTVNSKAVNFYVTSVTAR